MLLRNYSMYDLIPLIEAWLESKGFKVSILANKIEGLKRLGIFYSEKLTVFLEDYINCCLIKLHGSTTTCAELEQYLKSLPSGEKTKEKEVIIREREIVSIPCPYCGALVILTERKCPNCGAYIRM